MMSDNDLSKKLSEIQDTKPRMSDPEIGLGPSRAAMAPKPAQGNRWSMWPMYMCFGVLLMILIFSILPRLR